MSGGCSTRSSTPFPKVGMSPARRGLISVVVLLCKHMYVRVSIVILDSYPNRYRRFFPCRPLLAIFFQKLWKKFFPLCLLLILEMLVPVTFFGHELKTRKVCT